MTPASLPRRTSRPPGRTRHGQRAQVAALTVVLLCGFAACSSGASRERGRPAQADGRCSRAPDETAAVNARIAETGDGSTISFSAGACLRIDGTVKVAGRHNLTIDGRGTTFTRVNAMAGVFDPQWLIQGSSGIRIVAVKIVGPKPETALFHHDYEGQPGIAIDNSTNVTVERSSMSSVWGDFFRISNSTDGVTITRNELVGAGRQGLAVVGGSNITFDNNVVVDAGRFAVDLEPYPSTPVHRIRISNNRLVHPAIGFVCATGSDPRCNRGPALYDVTVANNVEIG